jgi:23S rRNA pseudouridine1911/1915/1917 synthase
MQFIVPPELGGSRLDAALAALCPDFSRTRIKACIEAGEVQLNEAPCLRPRSPVHAGDRLRLDAQPVVATTLEPQALRFGIAYEDEDLFVIEKPAGLVVHPGAGNPDRTLVNGLLYRDPNLAALPRAGVVHRLDKDTSGLLLVARTSAAFLALTRQMAGREIHRIYAAIVHGVPHASGTVDAAIGRDRLQRTRMRVAGSGREAVTHYRVLTRFRMHAHLELALETGRTHQIRVHMQHLGHPLLGDPTYARGKIPRSKLSPALAEALDGLERQALHARVLEFEHPASGEPVRVTSPLPADFRRALNALRGDASTGAHMSEE